MSTAAAQVSTWSRRFTLASVAFFVIWGLGALAGVPRETELALALFGAIFHMIFGKGYALLPTYFGRSLSPAWLPAVQFPLTLGGAGLLAAGSLTDTLAGLPPSGTLTAVGASLWFAGVVVFVGGFGWSVRDNLTGRETATGEHNQHRRPVDRRANLFMPVALAYLLAGSYEGLAGATGLPPLLDGYRPRGTHLLAVGTATLLVFSIGFRLFPRLLRAAPPRWLVAVVLSLGAVAPLGLAVTLPTGDWFVVFAILQAGAVGGYTLALAVLYTRTDHPRVGAYGVFLGGIAGVAGVAVGVWLAVSGLTTAGLTVHLRLNLLGFLGLTIIGTTYQFYPPVVSDYPGGNDRTAALSLLAIALGLAFETAGELLSVAPLAVGGQVAALLGVVLFAVIVVGVFISR